MGSEPKEMKYRRRGRVSQPGEHAQCSDRSAAVDWGAFKHDPAELLRKLDQLRDQITKSCEVAGPLRGERHRMSRRAFSMRPSHAEPLPPPPGRAPEYYRSRYADQYGHGLPLSSYDQLQRSVGDERYPRQPSGRFRQCPERQWENYGYGQGNCHQSTCRCVQCVHGQRTMAQEENIPMARYFAGQQGSYQFQRSSSISSEYDRRSVASSLYSHLSISKRKMEYFRKKAESFCRPVKGAAPFIVCSSCNQLLQLLLGKCASRKQNQVQCGSCSEVITFKLKEMKVHPLIPSLLFPVLKSVRSSTLRAPLSIRWYPNQDDDSSSFNKLQAYDSQRQDRDFSGNVSLSSTTSYDSSNKEHWSNKSIQFKSVSASRSRFADSPKDILCQGDADSQMEASALCAISPQAPILEDKLVDCSGGDQIRSKKSGLNTKADYYANVRSERIDVKCEQKSNEGRKDGFGEETFDKTYEQKDISGGDQFRSKKYNVRGERIYMKCEQNCKEGLRDKFGEGTINIEYEQKCKQGNAGCHEDQSMGSEYKQKANTDDSRSSLEDEVMDQKYEGKSKQDHSSLEAQGTDMRYDKCNEQDYDNTLQVESISKRCEEESTEDDYGKSLFSNCENAKTGAKSESSVNERRNTSSRVSSDAELDALQSLTVKSGDSSFFAAFLKKGFKDLSLFNQSAESVKVSINGHPISDRALRKAEKKAGPVGPGSYWYDQRAGFWGVMGHECSGIIPPFIKEFSYSMPKDCAGGNTGVLVNGRELHHKDFDLLVKRGLPRISGKSYSVEITGIVTDDTSGMKLRNLGKLAPTIEKMKRGFGMHVPEEIS